MGRNRLVDCPFRPGIICDGMAECNGCGWNPDVEKRRIHAIREERKTYTFVRRSFVPGEHKNFFHGEA